MWQRIQTVFLALIVIALLVSLVQPIWSIRAESGDTVLTPFYLIRGAEYQYFPFTLIAILSVASITLAAMSITRYKNRILQIKLGALNSLVLVGVLAASVYFASQLLSEFQGGGYGLGMYLPIFAAICNLAANYFIRKDERLVRSSERLR
ncbi:MAG TPA: DUF4293 domain-containing protein [Cyclobacteriaceae bacterium]|jgi:hypothetical protein|nr:DUF4293 domain-containing protein [Cyclobacteriaceae bacterium]